MARESTGLGATGPKRPGGCGGRSAELDEQLLELVGGHAVAGSAVGVRSAVLHACGDQAEPDLVEGGLGGGQLGDDVGAVGTLLNEALDAPYLALHPAEPAVDIIGDLFWEAHGPSIAVVCVPRGV